MKYTIKATTVVRKDVTSFYTSDVSSSKEYHTEGMVIFVDPSLRHERFPFMKDDYKFQDDTEVYIVSDTDMPQVGEMALICENNVWYIDRVTKIEKDYIYLKLRGHYELAWNVKKLLIHNSDIKESQRKIFMDGKVVDRQYLYITCEKDGSITRSKFSKYGIFNYKPEYQEAIYRFEQGKPYSTSTFIDEDTIIAGYGGLQGYDFRFPLPPEYIIHIFGTRSWSKYHDLMVGKSKIFTPISDEPKENVRPLPSVPANQREQLNEGIEDS